MPKKLQNLKQELETSIKKKIQINYEPGDLTNFDDITKIIKKVRKRFNTIDILLNCAGVFIIKPLSASGLDDFEKCFRVNVIAPFIFSKEFSKEMIKNKWGRIINIGSSSSYNGFKKGTVYCSSKHSILGLSRALHDELKEYNIRVLFISPASTKTDMGKLSKDQDFNTFLEPKEVAEFIVFLIPFDREMIVEETRLNRMTLK